MSAQHNTFRFLALLIVILTLTACGGGSKNNNQGENDITMYISLGPSSGFPENGNSHQDNIFFYWGRSVQFSAQGLDQGVNDDIVLSGTGVFDWTGESYDDGTLYASHVFTLENSDGDYPGGRFLFKMFIDWNNNKILDGGDIYFGSYTVYADQDDDVQTEETPVDPEDWGTFVVYNEHDDAIIIDDPLDTVSGTPWLIGSIGEGQLMILQ